MRHALHLQSQISLFMKVFISLHLRNLGWIRCLICRELCKKVINLQTEILYLTTFGCNSWSKHGKELEFDLKRVRNVWIVIYRWRCHYFQNPTIEHFGFRKNISLPVLELVDCQGHLADSGGKYGSFICNRFLEHIRKIGPHKSITDVVMFDVASNVQLSSELLKIHYP